MISDDPMEQIAARLRLIGSFVRGAAAEGLDPAEVLASEDGVDYGGITVVADRERVTVSYGGWSVPMSLEELLAMPRDVKGVFGPDV